MRLLSALVRNYRIHHELRVDFDPCRTVIGGPNEAGKSTLIEAVHRGLFLKGKVTGDAQRGMVSNHHSGHPEVTVAFETGGKQYRVLKRFSGTSGTTTLTEVDGPTWTGEEAESHLAALLGVEALTGGRGVGDRAAQQWAHLWVWQGQAGMDPTAHANEQRDTLLARLQGNPGGGAAVMQSERDAQVAARIAELFESLFNKNESPRKDSEQSRALEDVARAREQLEQARAFLARLQQEILDVREAEAAIETHRQAMAGLLAQKREVETRLARVTELQTRQQTQAFAAESAGAKLRALQESHQQIQDLRTGLQRRTLELEPSEAETLRLAEAETACRRRQLEAEAQYRAAIHRTRLARRRHELASACVGLHQQTAQRDQLMSRWTQVRELRGSQNRIEHDLAGLPPITPVRLKALEKLEKARDKAAAALEAMAAGIAVIEADLPVCAGGVALEAGQTRVLTEDTEITVGPHVRVRITPGGGTSLAEARQRVLGAQGALQLELDKLGLPTTPAASEACARRQQLERDLQTVQVRLRDVGADTIEKELADAEKTRAATEAEIQRRAEAAEGLPTPSDLAAATAMLAAAEPQLRQAESDEQAADAARLAEGGHLASATARLAGHRQAIQAQRDVLTRLHAQVRLLVETHGEDEARTHSLKESLTSNAAVASALAATREALVALQPDLLATDHQRLLRSIDQSTRARHDAETRRAVSLNALRSDGTTDPQEAFALAEAAQRSATQRLALAVWHAEAIKLLRALFIEEQRALAEQFTRPLSEKVSGYLQCLFGPGVRAQMNLEENAFNSLTVARRNPASGAFPFDALSGGAREQVAAAVRLGMAEVLAAGHGGCLPVVFDDAFAYADPERVQALQRMLDLAAERGLQVIVLTCNPADYAALGARQVRLAGMVGGDL